MSSEQDTMGPDNYAPPPTTPPKPKDWDNWRPIITQLWQASLTYEEIREFMSREHGFIANLSLFKAHFNKWELRKRARKDDVCYMAMVIRDRGLHHSDRSQRPIFLVRGHQYNYTDVERSLKRWRLSLDSLGTTPLKPSHIQVIESARSFPMSMEEKILFQTHHIYDDSFDHDTRLGSKDLKRCQNAFERALQAIYEREYISAGLHFNDALVSLGEALKQKSRHLLPLIYVATVYGHIEPSEIGKYLLNDFFRKSLHLVCANYGKQHPFTITLESLLSTQWTRQICVTALRKSLDLLYARNRRHVETIGETEIILSDTLRLLGEKGEALLHCRKVVRHREKLYPPFTSNILSALTNLVNCHFRFRDFQNAESILASVIGDDMDYQRWPRDHQFFELLRVRVLVMHTQGKEQERERLLSQAIRELLHSELDLDNADTILYSIARMMYQVNCPKTADWIRTQQIPPIQRYTAQRAQYQIREQLNSMVDIVQRGQPNVLFN